MNTKKRIVTALIVVFVGGGGAVLAIRSGRQAMQVESRKPKPVEDRDLEEVFGSKELLTRFKAADRVTVQRLRSKGGKMHWSLDDYEGDPPIAVPENMGRELKRLLVQDASYDWNITVDCAPTYGVLFNFHTGERTIRVALCFECGLIGIFDDTNNVHGVNLEDSFGPMHGEVGKFAKQLFPNDKEIQEIRGWPTQEEIRAHSARTVD